MAALRDDMQTALLKKSARNLLTRLEVNVNRPLDRQFIPKSTGNIAIETTSLCNLECRFCAYTKKQNPRVSMSNDFFAQCVEQAVEIGYDRYDLTPCTGDVFMDRKIFDKFDFLDAHPKVAAYYFFTNLTIPKAANIERLVGLKKLINLTVSIYGHDLDTFMAITKSTEKVYRRLMTNLERLYALLDRRKFEIVFGVRSTRDMPSAATTDLLKLLERFDRAGISVRKSDALYNNWGGYITAEDVKGLAMDITSADAIYKMGACVHMFTSVQIMANGIVNACSCRDVDATLRIGDINMTPLREIISTRNPVYMTLIEEQEGGEFRPICKSCDFYKSIYHYRSKYRKNGTDTLSLDDFKKTLDRPLACAMSDPRSRKP